MDIGAMVNPNLVLPTDYVRGLIHGIVYPYVNSYLKNVGHEMFHHLASLNIDAIDEEIRSIRPDFLGLGTPIVPFMILHHGFEMRTDPDLLILSSVRLVVKRVIGGKRTDFVTPVAVFRVESRLYLMAYEWCMPTKTLGDMRKSGAYPELEQVDDEFVLIINIRNEINRLLNKLSDKLTSDRRSDFGQVQSFDELRDKVRFLLNN